MVDAPPPSLSELNPSAQNYLKAVWTAAEWTAEPVATSTIAARVGVRQSTVSDAVRKLAEQGLVDHSPYGAVELTPAGRTLALAMVRRHRLLETFLVTALGYRWDEVHDEAETLEHAVSDLFVDRVDAHLGHPERDPHGDPIPTADGTVARTPAVTLTELGPGRAGRVERISDADPGLLQHCAEAGIGIGSTVETAAGAPYSGALAVALPGGTPVSLGRAATDAIWVSPRD